MTINQATIDLIKKWEGFKAEAYLCPANVWTIGYGITAGAGIGVDPKPGMRVTRAEAEEHLRMALDRFAAQIRPAITAPINENEFGAFVSLAYNIGTGGFRSSSALRHFNAGDKARAANAMKAWNKARVGGKLTVLQGLVNRREDEVKLFQTPPQAAQTAPQPRPAPTPAPQPQSLWARILRALLGILSKRA
jgi:lysozyme